MKKKQAKGGSGGGLAMPKAPPLPPHPEHRGEPVRVGPYTILAGGIRDLVAEDLEKADVLIPLLDSLPRLEFGRPYQILAAPLADYGGVPNNWEQFLREQVIPLLATEKKVLAFCHGSHGRTGCFLASLIAILETPEETPDPIAAVRKRHCKKAVESQAQAEAVFALRGEKLPQKYSMEFTKKPATVWPLPQDNWWNFLPTAH
ncbi:MAG: hypothetical protein HGA31_02240 [Candidatus Moranbacteria bacterium]|nr:hypothetical protein [Candidatus Moranbacteria bacterium]